MRAIGVVCMVVAFAAVGCAAEKAKTEEEGWVSLFDGKSLDGWKASEKAESFSVRDGMICVETGRSHLYYVGPVQEHKFKNFEFQADVMTKSKANSGIYFHTQFQQNGWPGRGMECQVNNTHGDPKKTGSLYNIKNVMHKSPAKDDTWFHYHIIVAGGKVTIKIDGQTVTEWTQAEKGGRRLGTGTFALQAHDPGSKVYYKNIRVKPLPD